MSRGEAVERIAMATALPRIPFTYRYGNVGWRSKLPGERQGQGTREKERHTLAHVHAVRVHRGKREGEEGGRKNRDETSRVEGRERGGKK